MEARELIDKAPLGPDARRVINQAFDDAWSEIAADYSDGAQAEAARTQLAKVLLSLASDDSTSSGRSCDGPAPGNSQSPRYGAFLCAGTE
jgi:hypothetical protein